MENGEWKMENDEWRMEKIIENEKKENNSQFSILNSQFKKPRLRFPEFKDSGEWEETLLENITCGESSNLAFNKLKFVKDGYPVYGADSIVGYIDTYQHENQYISIVKDGSGVGRLNLCKEKSSTLGTLYCIKSKDNDKYNLVWIYYALNRIDFSSLIKGGGIPHIYYRDIKKKKIPVPSLPEQQKIADFLSNLDELIEAHKQKLELLKKHKKGLMQNLFPQEGEKVPKLRFPEFKNSGEWEEKELGEIGELSGSGVDKKIRDNEKKVELLNYLDVYKKNFITSDDLQYETTATEQQIKKCEIKKGDVFFTPTSEIPDDIAQSAVALEDIKNGVYSYHLVRFRLKEHWDVKFRTYVFKTKIFFDTVSKLAQGSGTRYVITLPEFRSIKVLIPSLPEQQKIADFLSSLDELIDAEEKKIEQLERHKKGLMQGLFPMEKRKWKIENGKNNSQFSI